MDTLLLALAGVLIATTGALLWLCRRLQPAVRGGR